MVSVGRAGHFGACMAAVDRALVACKCCRLLVRCVKTEGSPIFAQYRRGDDRVAAIEASIASDRWIPACYDCKCLQRNSSECAGCAARLAEKRSRLEADVAAAEAAVDAAVASFKADDTEAAASEACQIALRRRRAFRSRAAV